jgi:hypothetical protein
MYENNWFISFIITIYAHTLINSLTLTYQYSHIDINVCMYFYRTYKDTHMHIYMYIPIPCMKTIGFATSSPSLFSVLKVAFLWYILWEGVSYSLFLENPICIYMYIYICIYLCIYSCEWNMHPKLNVSMYVYM